MLLVSCYRGQLQTVTDAGSISRKEKGFSTGLSAIDELLPGGVFAAARYTSSSPSRAWASLCSSPHCSPKPPAA